MRRRSPGSAPHKSSSTSPGVIVSPLSPTDHQERQHSGKSFYCPPQSPPFGPIYMPSRTVDIHTTPVVCKYKDEKTHRTRINNYLVGRVLGTGQLSSIREYIAIDPQTGEVTGRFACKRYRKGILCRKKQFKRDPETGRMHIVTKLDEVKNEIWVLSQLDHPNCLRLHEVLESGSSHMEGDGKLYIITNLQACGGVMSLQDDVCGRLDLSATASDAPCSFCVSAKKGGMEKSEVAVVVAGGGGGPTSGGALPQVPQGGGGRSSSTTSSGSSIIISPITVEQEQQQQRGSDGSGSGGSSNASCNSPDKHKKEEGENSTLMSSTTSSSSGSGSSISSSGGKSSCYNSTGLQSSTSTSNSNTNSKTNTVTDDPTKTDGRSSHVIIISSSSSSSSTNNNSSSNNMGLGECKNRSGSCPPSDRRNISDQLREGNGNSSSGNSSSGNSSSGNSSSGNSSDGNSSGGGGIGSGGNSSGGGGNSSGRRYEGSNYSSPRERFTPGLKGTTTLPEGVCRCFIRDAARGLHYMHEELNMAHRDVKPNNLLLGEDGVVQLGDMDTAEKMDDNGFVRHTKGTYMFMAPECMQVSSAADEPYVGHSGRAADVWALGITLYIMLLARPPFDVRNSLDQLFEEIARGEVEIPATPALSPGATEVLRALLQKDVGQRITLEELLEHPWIRDADSRHAQAYAAKMMQQVHEEATESDF